MDDAQFRIFRFATLYSKYGSELDNYEGDSDYEDLVLEVHLSFLLYTYFVI